MIPKKLLSEDYLAKLSLFNDPLYIRPAQEMVRSFASMFSFADEELKKLELVTEEALLNVIENSFDPGEIGMIELKILQRAGNFIISIEDKGIPSDAELLEKREEAALGLLLMRNLMDEFNLLNLGRDGKRIELIKALPEKSIGDLLSPSEYDEVQKAEPAQESDVPQMRIVQLEDAPLLSRLAYRVYGYTYSSVFYYPEKIRELIENGLLVSAVSINKTGDIVGNLSLFYEHKGAPVADSGAAMVDPRYRGHSLFKESKKFLKNYAIKTGMYGIYSEAVTIHSFTQQGNISLGAKETGIMLAYVGQAITFKKIGSEVLSQRQAVVLYYLKTNEEPSRDVYLCEKFFPILDKVYKHLELNRKVISVGNAQTTQASREKSVISTTIKPDFNIAVITLKEIGNDAVSIIIRQLKELCLKKIDTIYAEIPVHEPYAAFIARELNEAGFLMSGIVPELHDGDILKMQYLNNVFVDPEKIVIAAPLAKELLQEIMKDYQ